MAVLRRHNWLGQGRVDVPHLREIESSASADFDLLAGRIVAGRQPLVVRGFAVLSAGATLAEQLRLQVADSILIHFFATESGSIFQVRADQPDEILDTTNPRINGSFTPSQTNYVGIDLTRTTDPSTSDIVVFLDSTDGREVSKEVPLARTLKYTIVISTTDFSATPGIAPVAKVTTDASNHIVALVDARYGLGRLGLGGATPDPQHIYPWPGGRKEGSSGDPFAGGDKAIGSLKEWMDAAMTRLWELGGGEYWYSGTADRNVRMVRSGTVFVSTGEYFEWSGTHLHWRGLKFVLDNSPATFNDVKDQTTDLAGTTDLADGECIYVDVDRSTNRSGGTALVAVKTSLALLGQSAIPGARYAIAWRSGSTVFTRDQPYAVGGSLRVATMAAAGTVKLSETPGGTADPIVAVLDSHGGIGSNEFTGIAIAAGLSRGGPTSNAVGSGSLNIGGLNFDQDVNISPGGGTSTPFAVTISGDQNTPVSGRSTLEVISGAVPAPGIRAFRIGSGVSGTTTKFALETIGTIELGNVVGTPGNPDGTQIRAKLFLRDNGVASPNKRDQLMVMWWDGSTTQLGQSPTY